MSGFLVPGEFVCKDFVSYQNEHQSRVTTSIHLHPDIASEPPRLPQHHAKPRAVTGRVIRCPDDLKWIVQHYLSLKWRNKSYHREWWSIERRYPTNNYAIANPDPWRST